MDTLTTNIVSTVYRHTRKLGFLNSLADAVVKKIAPHTTASACATGYTCGYYCGGPCGGGIARIRVYAMSPLACNYPEFQYECSAGCLSHCAE
ncbi:MAG: hypothetical protein WCD37_16850 [Chloroflexia bacterium]